MADTDLEFSALPTTDEIDAGDEILLVRDGAPIRFIGILPTENGVSDAVAVAEAAAAEALAYGSGTVKATWAEAAALTGQANGAIVTVVSTDTADWYANARSALARLRSSAATVCEARRASARTSGARPAT